MTSARTEPIKIVDNGRAVNFSGGGEGKEGEGRGRRKNYCCRIKARKQRRS